MIHLAVKSEIVFALCDFSQSIITLEFCKATPQRYAHMGHELQAAPIRKLFELKKIDLEIPKQDCTIPPQQRKNMVSGEVRRRGTSTIYDAPEIFKPSLLRTHAFTGFGII